MPAGTSPPVRWQDKETVPVIAAESDGRCLDCGKQFKGQRGLSLHSRSAHPELYHKKGSAEIAQTIREQTRTRWDGEESAVMAHEEVRLLRQGCMELNKELSKFMTGRSFHSVKSHRRQQSYRALVKAYVPTTGGLGVKEVAIPPRKTTRVVGEMAPRPHADPREDEVGQPLQRPAARVAEACPPRLHSPPQQSTNQPPAEAAEVAFPWPNPLDEHEVELPETVGIDTPTRAKVAPTQEQEIHAGDEFDWRTPIRQTIIDLATGINIQPELLQSSTQNPPADSGRLQNLIDQDIMELLPPVVRKGQNMRPGVQRRVAQSSREKRRAAYSRTQALYKKSRTSCARTVLTGKWREVAPNLSLREQEAFWAPLLETPSIPDRRAPPGDGAPEWDIMAPITTDEVARHLRGMKDGATGPDNRTLNDVRKLGVAALACRFNVWMLTGIAPEAFRHGVTVLIPKTPEGAEPHDYRPITIGPILGRAFHRILAERIERHYRICGRQKAFRKGDGIGENTFLLRTVIADRKARNQSTNVAFLDVSKAFDSVSHDSIFLAAASAGIPDPLVTYIKSVYAGSQTQLRVDGTLSRAISVNRGVKQGDPLSPVLFNSVIDLALRKIDDEIGVSIGTDKLSCLAFADDLVLLASTPRGLQSQFKNIELALGKSGLKLNVNKSATIRLDVDGKRKTWVCNPSDFLRGQDGQLVKAMSITDGYKYLGNSVSAGVTLGSTVQDLQRGVRELTAAPLKPQQRMYILRNNLIPSLHHTAVLGCLHKKSLKFLDQITRAAARAWLRLPKDTPLAFFHADYQDGGLSIPSLRWTIPLMKTKRMAGAVASRDPMVRAIAQLPIFARERRRWSAPLAAFGVPIINGAGLKRAMAVGLHTSVDGHGLAGSRVTGYVNHWMVSGTALMSGSGFVNCVRIKGNLPYTKARAARGRPERSVKCDACRGHETLGHILQTCPRTHQPRNDRHDRVNKYLTSTLGKLGFTTRVEPAIATPAGVRYPDLIVWKGDTCAVIDTTIVADNFDPDDAHERKVVYYDTPAIRTWCADISGVPADKIKFSACVLTWRGMPSTRSVRELQALGVSKANWGLMSVKTLEGAVESYAHFGKSTAGFSG